MCYTTVRRSLMREGFNLQTGKIFLKISCYRESEDELKTLFQGEIQPHNSMLLLDEDHFHVSYTEGKTIIRDVIAEDQNAIYVWTDRPDPCDGGCSYFFIRVPKDITKYWEE